MAERLRLVFMGSDPVAIPLLDWLAGEGGAAADLVGIFTGPDRPSGRGQEVRPNAVAAWAAGRPTAVLQPERLDCRQVLASRRGARPDAALVVAYGHILRDDFISAPRLGNAQPPRIASFPEYRGASPDPVGGRLRRPRDRHDAHEDRG